MESGERAGKKRKLSHDGSIGDVQSSAKENQQAKLRKTSLLTGVDGQSSDKEGEVPITNPSIDSRPIEDIEAAKPDNVLDGQNGTTAPVTLSSNSKQDDSELAANGHEEQAADPNHRQPDKPMSKSQQKRLRKQAEWESKREERKVIRKQKQAEKRTRQRAERRAAGQEAAVKIPRPVDNNKPRPSYLPITILIDCDFDSLMKDNELVSLAAQITRCYSDNRKSRFRAHLALCSFGGRLRKRFNEVLTHHKKWKGVKILEDEDFVAASERAKEWMRDEKYGGKLVGSFERYASPQEQQQQQQQQLANDEVIDHHASTNDPNESKANGHTEEAAEQVSEELAAEHKANDAPFEDHQPAEQGASKAAEPAGPESLPQAQPEPSQPKSIDMARIAALEQASETIYLTSEATETLTELKPYSTYIIGGLVDKNREKGLCYRRATERGIRTARLPIGEFMEMQSRKVLATNHVSEIMVRWLECRDWGEAFMKVIPKRKGGKLLKGDGGHESGEHDDEEDGEDVVDDDDRSREAEQLEQDDDEEEEGGGIPVEAATET